MYKKIIIKSILLLFILLPLAAVDVSYNGLAHTSFATRFKEGDIAHYKQSIDLSIDMYKDISHFYIQPYATISKDNPVSFDIREAYVEFYLDSVDVKIGKQIIVSGQADALYLTDIVSPRNLKDFVLTETTDMRIGVPAVKASYYFGNYTFDGIWIAQGIPTTTYSQDSIWSSPSNLLPSSATITTNIPPTPELLIENSEVFAKLRYFGSSISYEFIVGNTYSDEPHISNLTITTPSPLAGTLDLQFDRYPILGGSFSTTLGSFVVRGESILSFNKAFSVLETTPSPSVVEEEHHYLQGLIGLDWKLFGFDMSSQYMLSHIFDYHEGIVHQGISANEYTHLTTFRVQKKFFEDRFTFQLFSLIELNPLNALIRPSITYAIEDAVSLKAEVLLFVGDENGLYGKYKDNSLTSLSLYWYF
jgi:hypothetical protein